MNYCGLMRSDIANGDGVRVTLWCAGCSIHCHGCQNPDTWDFNAGAPLTGEVVDKIITELQKPYVRGLTFSGGNPLEPANEVDVLDLIRRVRQFAPTKDIWLYTGRELDISDFQSGQYKTIITLCDYIVDGPYIESQRDITLAFRGSDNQRIIDVKKTLEENEIVLWVGA